MARESCRIFLHPFQKPASSPRSASGRSLPELARPLLSETEKTYTRRYSCQSFKVTSRHRTFLPGSQFLAYWDMFMFCCLISTGIVEPYVCVFGLSNLDLCYAVFFWSCTAAFLADICLRFFRAKKQSTREGVVLVTDLSELAKRYMRSPTFVVDVVSAVPIAQLLGSGDSRGLVGDLRLVRLLKFFGLRGTFHRIHDVTGWSFSAINSFQFVVMTIMVLHWLACLWALVGSRAGLATTSEDADSWFSRARDSYDFLGVNSRNDGDMYLLALYWSVTVVSSVGFGDITPQSKSEFLWAILCMLIGVTIWAYGVGSVCGGAASYNKHHAALKSAMNNVSVLSADQNFPAVLQERVANFYKHAKEFMRMQGYHTTIRDLSPALKGEVVSFMYGGCFKRVWYFDVVDERCAQLLAEGMIPKMYAPEEVIEDSVGAIRCLVFLRSGLCVRKCSLLGPGAVWGLDVILGSEEHHDIEELLDTAPARSINFVFVLKLSKTSIDHAATLVPSFAQRLRKAHLRMLLWRGVLAASRATKKLATSEAGALATDTPVWDKACKLMGQVVHQDCLLLHESADPVRRSSSMPGRRQSSMASTSFGRRRTMSSASIPEPGRQSSRFSPDRRAKSVDTIDAKAASSLPASSELDESGREPAEAEALQGTQLNHSPEALKVCTSRVRSSEAEKNKSAELTSDSGFSSSDSEADAIRTEMRKSDAINQNQQDKLQDQGRSRQEEKAPKDVRSEGLSFDAEKDASGARSANMSGLDWKQRIGERIEGMRQELSDTNEDLSEEVDCLRGEVSELSRLMHQLLERLHADEKY